MHFKRTDILVNYYDTGIDGAKIRRTSFKDHCNDNIVQHIPMTLVNSMNRFVFLQIRRLFYKSNCKTCINYMKRRLIQHYLIGRRFKICGVCTMGSSFCSGG